MTFERITGEWTLKWQVEDDLRDRLKRSVEAMLPVLRSSEDRKEDGEHPAPTVCYPHDADSTLLVMQPIADPPIHLGGGSISWSRDYTAEREKVHAQIARSRVEIAKLELRLAQIDADEQRASMRPSILG